MELLKPCPFCGETPIVDNGYEGELSRRVYWVECYDNCGAKTLSVSSEKEARTLWNTRLSEDATIAIAEGLKK